jgi:hypothetical protein
MIKSKLERIKKQIAEIKQLNRRYIAITHFINDDYFECQGIRFDTRGAVDKHFNITDDDDVMLIKLEFVSPDDKEDN